MGFEEAFAFVVAGCVASYYQRSQQGERQEQTIFLWILAIVFPSLAIAWTILNQTSLPLTFTVVGFLLGTWIYRRSSRDNHEIINLTPTEEKQLRNCFSPTTYHLKDLEYHPQEIYCRGSLRSQNHKYAYDTISQNIQKIFGDRFLCYLQESPIENRGRGFGASSNDQQLNNYCFHLIPNQNIAQFEQSGFRKRFSYSSWIASVVSIILTAFTVLVVGAKVYRLEDLNLNNLQTGLPYLLGIASIFGARAIAQYAIAKKYKLRFEPPILLPCFGGFGLLGNLHLHPQISPNPNNQRRILFDLAIISTTASLGISIILLILGNWLLVPTESTNSAISTSLLMPNLHSFDFKSSIFVTLLQAIFSIDKSATISTNTSEITQILSPLTLAGWTGLALSALQVLPFGLLDGGNLAIAMFGHRQTTLIARITRIVLLAIALLAQPWLRIYSLLLFLLPAPPPSIVNESIEIDRTRDLLGIGLMAIALLIILPMPKSIF
ncbi:hypothetical protein [Pseudanabaena sp. Chao 1811]|uniref:hypothetical protein n=1 Tax=Pseudanabaena sp. Chao 1811 TaxID=2963092 RepID=UPI0022F3F5C2|nr:hypothetical protein [Pseudanabaena sp. Chao 1811]